MSEKTHFGFEEVPAGDKVHRVRQVFDSVAGRYDLMNDLMSFGVHRLWKRFAMFTTAIRPGARVLDLAAGTGDITRRLSERVGERGEVFCTDINAQMLGEGRRRLIDDGVVGNVRYVLCNAERLPFPARCFDAVTIAFGLRNVTDKAAALAAICQCLRPGGQLYVLEFSTLRVSALRPLYDFYSFKALPWLGQRVAGDADSYRYLAESIRMHPPQEALQQMLEAAGFEQCQHLNLSAGIVALHRGVKL